MNMDIKKQLETIPKTPGVYKMLDKEGRVIYVGKAKQLDKRVKQYFKQGYQHSTRTKKLVEKIANINVISTDTELEALILENNLIKQLQPKYNIIMKDDKNYVYIKITKEDYPRIRIVRQISKDGAKYIGPKTAKHKVKDTLKLLKKIFPFRHCNLDITDQPSGKVKVTNKVIKYPCLDYYIKRCSAPCINKTTKEEYQEIISNVTDFLEGKGDGVINHLKHRMQVLAQEQKFEKAAKIRDHLLQIEEILEKQKVAGVTKESRDIINYIILGGAAYFNLFQVRDGILLESLNFILKASELEDTENQEVLEAFLTQYYEIATDIPKEILIPHQLPHSKQTEQFIQNISPYKTKLIVPKIGKNNRLLEMSLKNAKIYADRNKPKWQEESQLTQKAAEELQKILNIKKTLKRIECYDISHLSGTDTVASMVVFKNGAPSNKDYRQFKIRTVTGKPDDFKSMEEVLTRRLLKIQNKSKYQDYKFKKARKKDDKYIQEQSKKNLLNRTNNDYTHFHVLTKEDQIVAFGRTINLSKKVDLLANLFVEEKHRKQRLGHHLLKQLIKKGPAKRSYIACKPELKEYYLEMGFEEINKTPQEIIDMPFYKEKPKRLKDKTILVFEKLKLKEDPSFKEIPDLIIIDGGKGQLNAGTKVLQKLNLQIPYISLAKRLEEIFTPHSKTAILLERHNEALKLCQRARDEAHRFAITFNKKLRSKRIK